jgi:lipopolysaccharide export system permease protein
MQGSGESPWRLARPLLLAGFIISLAQYALNESIVPSFYSEQKRILTEDIKRQSVADRQSCSGIRLLGSGGRFFVAQFFDARASQLRQVSVQVKDGPILLERIDAKLARYQEGDWIFEDGVIRVFGDSTESAARFRRYATSEVTEVPLDFARTDEDPFHMSMRSLLAFARRLEEYGGETQKHMTNFHIRASFPLANLIMVLLGAALSLRIVRGSPVALGIGLSVSIGFAYFAFIRMGQALGYNGTLPPVVAAWLANVVFAVIGLFLFRKIAR